MKFMALILFFSFPVYAQKGGDFNQKKQRVLQKMQQRKTIIDRGIYCVEKASNPQAIQACKRQMRSLVQRLKGRR